MNIRKYNSSDRDACVGMFMSNVPEYFDPTELGGFHHWLDACDKGEMAFKGNAGEYYFVVEQNSVPVACGGYYIKSGLKDARMCWGMVHRRFHKQRIGYEFLEFRINEIRKNFQDCEIALDTSQHTFPFFEKLGFVTTKITENDYAPGLHRYDMVLRADAKVS